SIRKIQGRILRVPLLVSKLELVFALDPSQGVAKSETIVDCVSVHCIADIDNVRLVDNGEHDPRGPPRNSQYLSPVFTSAYANTRSNVLTVGAVVAQTDVIEDAGAEGVIVSETDIVSTEELA